MRHRATATFWNLYRSLPSSIRIRAEQQFTLLKADPHHPSLRFKKLDDRLGQELWSARVTLNYRALAFRRNDGYLWFWIGDHKTYDSLLK